MKHGVLVLNDASGGRRIASVRIVTAARSFPLQRSIAAPPMLRCIAADERSSRCEARSTCRALQIDVAYPYEFAEPIFRLGNDYSKGIIVSTGYVGQRMDNGLVSCLTDGHPGVSGGGVLESSGNLVAFPSDEWTVIIVFHLFCPCARRCSARFLTFRKAR